MDEAALQSSVILKEDQIKTLFVEYYYDCAISHKPTSSTDTSATHKTKKNQNNGRRTVDVKDIGISGV
jgi:hypothetical protein